MQVASKWMGRLLPAVGIAVLGAISVEAQTLCSYSGYFGSEGIAIGPKALAILHCEGRLVEDASELSASEDDGVYPASVSSFSGFLPGGAVLIDVATGVLDQPNDGFPNSPGKIGYTSIAMDGVSVGYWITLGTYVLSDQETYRTMRSTGPPDLSWLNESLSRNLASDEIPLPQRK